MRNVKFKGLAILFFLQLGCFLNGSTSTLGVSAAAPKAVVSPATKSKVIPHALNNAVNTFVKTVVDSRSHLAAAAVARSVSIFSMYPVDTIKTRMQMGKKVSLDGLYKGVGGSLFGQVPYGVLTFGSYEIYKQALISKFPSANPVYLYALSAIMGDITGSGWLCPSEVIKQQLQGGMHSNMMSAISSVWKNQGVKGFYQGYLGGLARDVPFRVAQLTSYEVTKSLYLKQKSNRLNANKTKNSVEQKVELNPVDSAICGAIAGSFSAAITCPLDRFKTLLMTDSAGLYGGSVMKCAAKIWQDEGVAGFTKGMVPRVTYIAPSVVIFFIAYEQVQQRMSGGIN